MDIGKLKTGDRLIVLSSIALVVCTSLPWFSFAEEFRWSGWHFFAFGVIPAALGLAMTAAVLVTAGAAKTQVLPPTRGRLLVGAGCAAAVLILVKLLTGERITVLLQHVSLSRRFGVYLAFLSAVGLAFGGIITAREHREGYRRR